ncbi:MAG TPA: alginate export family protein [Bryobacteraceae bacterium]|nr:alginate export family protein [Bryobacteraceae bacterium]
MIPLLRVFSRPLLIFVAATIAAMSAAPQPQTSNTAQGGEPSDQQADASGWLQPVEDLNRSLPPWLQFGGDYRLRLEGQNGIKFGKADDSYLLGRLRLNLLVKPSRWFSLFGETQDSRIFFNQHLPSDLPYQNTWDIRQAYAEFGSSTEGWIDVIAGRQVLSFGGQRLIGPSNWSNTGRTFDAIRVDVHQPDFKISLFASSVVVDRDGVIDHHVQGNNLHGIYSTFSHLIPRATIEPFVFWRLAPPGESLTQDPVPGALNEVTTGFRWTGEIPADFDYDVEMARQSGSVGSKSIAAWAAHWELGKTFRKSWAMPRLLAAVNYASGTRDPSGRTWSTFDQLYPSSHYKLGFADQVGWRNVEQFRLGVEEKAGTKWKLKQTYENFWLATTGDALYGNSGKVVIPASTTAISRHIGQEIDAIAEYQPHRAVTFGFGCAHLFAGQFLKQTSGGKDYNYPFAYGAYRF